MMSSSTVQQAPHSQPVTIPVPADFPVSWEEEQDPTLSWMQDRMHAPDPMPPFDYAFWKIAYGGFNRAAEAFGMPGRIRTRRINTYFYMTMALAVAPEEMEVRERQAEERIEQEIGKLQVRWETEWLPELRRHLGWWDAFDLRGASPRELLAHLDETAERMLRVWDVHFRIVIPVYVAMSQFADLHQDLFGGDSFGGYRLLQGFDNKTIEAGRSLWALSRRALASPTVRGVLESHATAAVPAALAQAAEGRAFLKELQAHLETYGLRGDKWGLSHPSGIEDPSAAIKTLQDYLARTEDPAAEQAVLAAARERAVAEARAALAGYPRPIVDRFEFLLAAAQQAIVLSEDHNFWIDFGASYRVRRVALEIGRRLAEAGVLERADDVFYLTLDEVRASLAEAHGRDRRAAVAERHAEVRRFRGVAAPPALGTDYGPPPDNAVTRFFGKLFGTPPAASGSPDVLMGHAGSPGMARGRARLVRSLADAGKLEAGDVLVAEATAPPWTPLFATAAAIVTDAGGILSHCAVVAREYRVPAVVGTGRATALIRDGDLLEVDGDAGRVRILSA
jgi:pyruvate,water dikinase